MDKNAAGINTMTTLPKKPQLSRSKEQREEESTKLSERQTPLKPNFKIKNVINPIAQANPNENIGQMKDFNPKKLKTSLGNEELNEFGLNDLSKRGPQLNSQMKPMNIYEKAGLKKTNNKPPLQKEMLDRKEKEEQFSDEKVKDKSNEKTTLIPFKPKPLQKSMDNDSFLKKKEEEKSRSPQKNNESDEEEILTLNTKNNEKPQKKNNSFEKKNEMPPKIAQTNKLDKNLENNQKKSADEDDEYADDFDDYDKEEFDQFEEEEEEKPKPIQNILKTKEIEKKDNKAKTVKKETEETTKKPTSFQKEMNETIQMNEKEKDNKIENLSILGNNNKALNMGKNYKKPFQKVSYNLEKLDERKINLEKHESEKITKEVSVKKDEAQRKRIQDFKNLIEMDEFEEFLDIRPSG